MYRFSIALDSKNSDCCGISNWEVSDGYFGALLCQMDGEQVEDIRDLLIRKLSRIVLYTVSMPVSDYDAYVRFFRNAHLIGVENIKLAYAAIDGAAEADIRKVLAIAESFSIKVLFELEDANMDRFGMEQYAALRSENTGLIFHPNEYLKHGIAPYGNVFSKMKYAADIMFLRVCDMEKATMTPVRLETGNSEIKECASKLLTRAFHGYFAFSAYSDSIPVSDVIGAFTETLCEM